MPGIRFSSHLSRKVPIMSLFFHPRPRFQYSIPRSPQRHFRERIFLRSSSLFRGRLPQKPPVPVSQVLTNVWKNFQIGPAFFIATAVLFVFLLSIITLLFSTRGVTKGYVLRDLEAKRQVLLRQNEVDLMQVAQAQALQALLHSEKISHMVPARNITFMRSDVTLASR